MPYFVDASREMRAFIHGTNAARADPSAAPHHEPKINRSTGGHRVRTSKINSPYLPAVAGLVPYKWRSE